MRTLITTCLLLITTTFFAQKKCENQVAKAVETLKAAMISADSTALYNISSAKLSYGHSGGSVENQEQFVRKIASGKSKFLTMDLSEQTITISGKTALVRHTLNAKVHDAGKDPADVKLKVLLVWKKEKGKWKLLARQAVKLT